MRFTREGWSQKNNNVDVEKYRKLTDSLSTLHGCLLYGTRVVIPSTLRPQVLKLLHEGHFGIQRMKQLAKTAVYWPNIDNDIVDLCRSCTSYAVHQNRPSKPPIHPWMVPEKPWSRLHLDHAVNFMGSNWLVLVDAYSKYHCIHPTSSISAKSTIDLMEQDFSHFGFPHTIVADNAPCFTSEKFKEFCKEREIIHLTGAPYHPSTNGAAECLVQTFKQALWKSAQLPKKALLDFLRQYRRTPTDTGFSFSQQLNGGQIRTKLDAILPSPAHISKASRQEQFLHIMIRVIVSRTSKQVILPSNFKAGDFLHQYRRTPTDSVFSPSQLLNGRQIRTKLDAILPSPAHISKESRQEQFLHMMIRIIISTTSKQVILATHSTLDLNKPRIRDGFQLWSLNELALVLFKFEQFPKVASGNITLINFDHDILQPKMMNQARTTLLTLTAAQILSRTIMHQNLPLKMNQNLQLKYLRTLYHIHPFVALPIHDDQQGPESKELSMVVL